MNSDAIDRWSARVPSAGPSGGERELAQIAAGLRRVRTLEEQLREGKGAFFGGSVAEHADMVAGVQPALDAMMERWLELVERHHPQLAQTATCAVGRTAATAPQIVQWAARGIVQLEVPHRLAVLREPCGLRVDYCVVLAGATFAESVDVRGTDEVTAFLVGLARASHARPHVQLVIAESTLEACAAAWGCVHSLVGALKVVAVSVSTTSERGAVLEGKCEIGLKYDPVALAVTIDQPQLWLQHFAADVARAAGVAPRVTCIAS